MFYKPKNFSLQEMLPRDYYKRYSYVGDKLWGIFDERILKTSQALRKRYGPIIMNTWHMSPEKKARYGNHQWRGFRDCSCTIGASRSQHRFARGNDHVFLKITAEEVRQDILADPFHEDFKYITCIEAEVPWLHADCRNWDKENNGILVVNP